jgi:hypothetical protein
VFPLFGSYPSLRAFVIEAFLYGVSILLIVGLYRKGMQLFEEWERFLEDSTRWIAQILLVVVGILLVNLLLLLLVTIWPRLSIFDFWLI